MVVYNYNFFQDPQQVTTHLRNNDEEMVRVEFTPEHPIGPDNDMGGPIHS